MTNEQIAARLRKIADTTETYSDRHSRWVAENLRAIATELEAQPAGDSGERKPYGDLRNAKWLDPECYAAGACQSLRFKTCTPAGDAGMQVVAHLYEHAQADVHPILRIAAWQETSNGDGRRDWTESPLVRQRDALAAIAARDARIAELEARIVLPRRTGKESHWGGDWVDDGA